MQRVKYITLDFRKMLSVSNNVLDASHSQDTLACLTAAIVIKCPNLTRLSVKIGTERISGQYYEDDEDKGHTTDSQWKVVGHIITLVLKVVRREKTLKTFDISFDLHDISTFLPHIVPGYSQYRVTNIMIEPNMLNLVFVKQMVNHYKELFGVILGKASINSLSIQMMGLLPTLVEFLVAVAESANHNITTSWPSDLEVPLLTLQDARPF